MTVRPVDREKLLVALRRMKRGDLLIIAERATELLPRAKLHAVFGDRIRLHELMKTAGGRVGLLEEVRMFHHASLRGDYYESFDVDSKNFMQKSEGTEEFIAEFDRMIRKCIRAAEKGPRAPVREAFQLLFGLLRHIDEGHDDIVFFADEGGSWQVDVNWRAALPAHFRCLADTALPDDFAREVDWVIKAFAEYERPRHLTAARRVATGEQKAALRALLKTVRQRRRDRPKAAGPKGWTR